MTQQLSAQRAGVCEVHLEQIDQGIGNLHGYERAFVVFRLHGSVIGQAWLPVNNGHISSASLRAQLPAMAWAIWKRLATETNQPIAHDLSASIVVCTRDRTDDLAQCLPGLSRLALRGHEVIIVDSCPSTDGTMRLVATYPHIRYIHEPRPGAGIARNVGLLAATRDIVAYTDDDAQVDAGWLDALLHNFDDPLVAIVTGITMPIELETDAQLWFEQHHGFARGFERRMFDTTNLNPLAAGLVGASVNMAFRRAVLPEVGLFDEALGPGTLSGSGEDHEFYYRTMARGYRIVYEPAALVWHRHRREWESLSRTIYGYGLGVFAWWTRALIVEREFSLLKLAPSWFWQHHVRQLIKALLRRPGHVPLHLAYAEFRGALAAPRRYLKARRSIPQAPLVQPPEAPGDATMPDRLSHSPSHVVPPPGHHANMAAIDGTLDQARWVKRDVALAQPTLPSAIMVAEPPTAQPMETLCGSIQN